MTTNRVDLIRKRLTEALQPTHLEVIDESEKHHGHPGAAAGGGHFAVNIIADAFNNKSLVECHRMVYEALGDLMKHEIHALRINAKPK